MLSILDVIGVSLQRAIGAAARASIEILYLCRTGVVEGRITSSYLDEENKEMLFAVSSTGWGLVCSLTLSNSIYRIVVFLFRYHCFSPSLPKIVVAIAGGGGGGFQRTSNLLKEPSSLIMGDRWLLFFPLSIVVCIFQFLKKFSTNAILHVL